MKRLTTEKAVITKLTPDAARSLIDNNVKNRPLRQKRINQLAKKSTVIRRCRIRLTYPSIQLPATAGCKGDTMALVVQIAPQSQCDALLEKQSEARMRVRANPLCNALNLNLRRFYRGQIRDAKRGKVLRFPL